MNFAANLHPALEHVGAAGFSAGPALPLSHKFTVSHATMEARCITCSGVFISPASESHSNKQYAKFFIPTSMLNTLVVVVVVVVVGFAATATGCGMKYIPSHEAIAGDGMNIKIKIWVFLLLVGCMRLGAFAA
jgi:hypothetical protein